MKINFKLFFILVGLTVIFSSCRTSAPRLDYQALARASVLLGIDINLEDDHKLYLEGPTVQAWFIKSIGKYIVSKCHETQKN